MQTIQSLQTILNNYSATSAPAITDNATKGYSIGSKWIDIVNKNSYDCVDAVNGVWKQNGYNVLVSVIDNTNHTITSGETGTIFVARSNTTAVTFTLPLISSVSSGFTVTINKNTLSNSVTTQASGSDIIRYNDATVASIQLSRMGDSFTLVAANGAWFLSSENIAPTYPVASTTKQGIIEIATQTEVNAGIDSIRAVVPSTLKTSMDGLIFGVNQAWQNVTGSRSSGVNYTNNTGKPIVVAVRGVAAQNQLSRVFINNTLEISRFSHLNVNGGYWHHTFIVPDGDLYRVSASGLQGWYELR